MQFGMVGQMSPGMRQVVEFGDRSRGRGNLIQLRVVVVWLTALAPVRLGTKQIEHVQQPPMLITRRANVTRELPQTLITGTAELVPIMARVMASQAEAIVRTGKHGHNIE